MPYLLDHKLVVGISSRALFDLEEENRIYENDGLDAYSAHQLEHENDILRPGTAFPLVKALHNLNTNGKELTEIIIVSRNSADTSLRIFNSINHYGLDISRAALVGGASIAPYLIPFRTDLFLSANESDVKEALAAGVASGLICQKPPIDPTKETPQIRIAFDGDAAQNLLKLMSIKSVMPFTHLIPCCPLLLLPPIFPSIRVFSNESVLCIR